MFKYRHQDAMPIMKFDTKQEGLLTLLRARRVHWVRMRESQNNLKPIVARAIRF